MTESNPTPYCWVVTDTDRVFFGAYAKRDAEREAALIGGAAQAFPLFAPGSVEQPAAYQDTAKPSELVSAEEWESIDPIWHWMYRPLYAVPPATAVPLTDDQIEAIFMDIDSEDKGRFAVVRLFARAIERALGVSREV